MTRRIFCILHLCLCSAIQTAFSQDDIQSRIEFACVSFSKLPSTQLYYLASDAEYLPLDVPFGTYSKSYTLRGVNALRLYVSQTSEDGQKIYLQCAEGALIAGSRKMLFVVGRAEDSSRFPLQLYGLNDALNSFPSGAFRFVNFTRVPLTVSFDGKTDQVSAGSIAVIKPEPVEGGGFFPFLIQGPSGQTFFETRLYGRNLARETVFIAPPSHDPNRLTVKFLNQTVTQQ